MITFVHVLPHLSDWRCFLEKDELVHAFFIRESNSALKNNCFDEECESERPISASSAKVNNTLL